MVLEGLVVVVVAVVVAVQAPQAMVVVVATRGQAFLIGVERVEIEKEEKAREIMRIRRRAWTRTPTPLTPRSASSSSAVAALASSSAAASSAPSSSSCHPGECLFFFLAINEGES